MMASRNRPKPASRRPNHPRKAAQSPRRSVPGKPPAGSVASESPLRTAVAERSRGLVVWLSRQPQFLIPIVMLVLVVAGLAAPVVVAVVALVAVLLFIGWLAFLSWPVLGLGHRAIRLAMIVVIVGTLVGRIAGWL